MSKDSKMLWRTAGATVVQPKSREIGLSGSEGGEAGKTGFSYPYPGTCLPLLAGYLRVKSDNEKFKKCLDVLSRDGRFLVGMVA